ncbi:hypothetical protein SD70_26085 [Gordoniibacillus kamchatkensis]|uniref:Uncharacterized protein n=1 Tax=Gordoniibacillus kamchatkensis TaxID=1590651 RepID=A0ABR5ACU9_9BACL|nr:hypothetical protein [Paenibacillus sp. VKM B-2647]KIL38508.1 hypothetical protein SD70_26085 [Paenibacillus sp. VKM B-2647]
MNKTTELLDNAININRLIWIMNDEDADVLFNIAKRHLQLAKEALDRTCTAERKTAIQGEIERLRTERDSLIKKYAQ